MSRKNSAASASQTANSSDNGRAKLWERDETTKRIDNTSNPIIAAQIKQIEQSDLPASVKNAALAGLRAQQAADKPFALTVCRATGPGRCDLIEVSGGFKNKMLSPRLLGEIAAHAAFVAKFVEGFNGADE